RWNQPVFNLSVAEDESYICDGIATHNCRCNDTPLTVRFAAEKGIKEAQQWLETGIEPSPPAFVPMPPFLPPPEFRRSLNAAPLSVQMSLNSLETFCEPIAMMGMVGNEWHGPQPPAPNWVLVRIGAKGGKVWKSVSSVADDLGIPED